MQFGDFLRQIGLIVDRPMMDGRIHRCATEAKPRKRNGAYRYMGEWGWGQSWDAHQAPVYWRPEKRDTAFQPVRRPDMARVLAEQQEARQRAAARAVEIISGCQFMSHPYLTRKGFPRTPGLVDAEDRLVVPMRSLRAYERVQSIQWIWADGTKKFLPGGAAREGIFIVGPTRAPETWLCEGLATAYSIEAALKYLHRPSRVMVCFSAGTLAAVGQLLEGRVFVVADNDASRAGQEAAEATGKKWCMPPEPGMDSNDLHQQQGLATLAALLRSVM